MINKILIVDDSGASRMMLKRCLPKDRGYELHEAADGRAGVDKYKEINPDVTFMDLTMPVMNGMEALAEIRKFDERAVVIVATADIQVKSIAKVMELGATTVLRKPMKKDNVQAALQQAEDALKVQRVQ